jgi:hypothetical protein
MYILDTDHLGILQRRRGHEFDQLVQKITAIGDVNVYVTIISFRLTLSRTHSFSLCVSRQCAGDETRVDRQP